VALTGDDAIEAELLLHDPSARPIKLQLQSAKAVVALAAIFLRRSYSVKPK
jgi:hypothetical protein